MNCVFTELRVNVHITLKRCPCFDPRDPMDPTDWLMNIEISGVPRRTDPCGIEKRCTLRSWAYLLLGLFYQMTCSTKLVRIFWPKGSYMFSFHCAGQESPHLRTLCAAGLWRLTVSSTRLFRDKNGILFFCACGRSQRKKMCIVCHPHQMCCLNYSTVGMNSVDELVQRILRNGCKWSFTWLE
jgi:hypothetical protein